jgi:uncharacterized membrane protein YdjX (TVP38/TMEM64 family)
MKKKNFKKLKAGLNIFFILFLFVLISFLVQTNSDYFYNLIGPGFLGILIYSLLNILAIVIAPLTVFPIVIIATSIWGWFLAGIITLISWTIGAIIAFVLARKYGIPLIRKFVPLNKLYKLESKILKYNKFFSIVFLRAIIPVDILSYALGLFTSIKFWTYTLATIIGMIPFIFIYTYFGSISFSYQIFILSCLGIFYLIILFFDYLKKRSMDSI